MSEIRPLIISRTPPYLGGREVVVDMLIRSFSKAGPVCVVTPDNYPVRKNVDVLNSDKKREDIARWAKEHRVTVINCHTFYLSNLAFYLSEQLGIPLIFTLHGVFIDFYGKKYGNILRRIYAKSDLVITVSKNYRRKLGKYLGSCTKLITIKNGVDVKAIDKVMTNSVSYYRKKYSIPRNKFVVLVPARLTYLKGIEYLVEAASTYSDKNVLFLVCSPNGRNSSEETAYKKNLQSMLGANNSSVKFVQLSHRKILEYYQCSDMVILPSLIEGLSVSLLEAMCFGRVVVATRVGGNPEIIKDKVNGFLIKAKDPVSIIRMVRFVKKNIDKVKTGVKARETVENQFLRDTMVTEYYRVFKKIQDESKQRCTGGYFEKRK